MLEHLNTKFIISSAQSEGSSEQEGSLGYDYICKTLEFLLFKNIVNKPINMEKLLKIILEVLK